MYLIRSVEKWEYAQDILKGRLYMNPLRHFKELEQRDLPEAGRADSHEGVSLYQGKDMQSIILSVKTGPGQRPIQHTVARKELVRISSYLNVLDRWNILSMFGRYPRPTDQIEDIDECLRLGNIFPAQRLSDEFGIYSILIHDLKAFFDRVDDTCRSNGYGMKRRFVSYYDPKEDSVTMERGNPDPDDLIFYKRNVFSYQKEYRIAIDADNERDNPHILEIGDLTDIACLLETRSINISASVENDTLSTNIRSSGVLTMPIPNTRMCTAAGCRR